MIDALIALDRLRKGNKRFVMGRSDPYSSSSQSRREEIADGQEPFAIILGCSDSRVPAELVFDQGLGDLFVIRVAGNVVAPSQVGSVEFAASMFHVKLVVVLGHTQCGAVLATLDELQRPAENQSQNIRSIVDRIRPSVEPLLSTESPHGSQLLVERAVRANVRYSVHQLRHGSGILETLVRNQKLLIVGAEYSLDTGEVQFLDDLVTD